MATTLKPSYGATVVMTVTNLQSLGSSATVGWQSDKVSNIAALATDFEIFVKLTTAFSQTLSGNNTRKTGVGVLLYLANTGLLPFCIAPQPTR